MAFMSQEQKKKIAGLLKPTLKKYGVKASLSVRNHSTLVMTIQSAPFDLIANCKKVSNMKAGGTDRYMGVNPYWYHEHFDGVSLDFLKEAFDALYTDHWDKSDIMSDYHHVAWYVDVTVGKWDKPFVVTA